jgi:hypothetical protein
VNSRRSISKKERRNERIGLEFEFGRGCFFSRCDVDEEKKEMKRNNRKEMGCWKRVRKRKHFSPAFFRNTPLLRGTDQKVRVLCENTAPKRLFESKKSLQKDSLRCFWYK